MSAVERCEAAVTVRTRYVWAMSMECGELLYGKKLPLKLKGTVYKSNERPAISKRKRDINF